MANNAIFFCEILGCKKIILIHNNNIYIRNKIINQKYNMSIELDNSKDFLFNKTINLSCLFFYYYYRYLKPENRINIVKNEILNNLPKIITNSNDLYIHIRSGDIFNRTLKNSYSQPPFCFYKKILNNFNFRKVFIISQNKNNPVINKLISEYSYIIYNQNLINIDISYLANSYNIVSSVSSFIIGIIKLNDYLKYVWEYDIYKLTQKYFHLHYSVYNFEHNYTIYQMKPSQYYKRVMNIWQNSPKQKEIMINEKCKSNFKIIHPYLNI